MTLTRLQPVRQQWNSTLLRTAAAISSIKARPEDGDLILWGAAMTFDAKLDVHDSTKRKVGRISIER
jgi:hypothetical protein